MLRIVAGWVLSGVIPWLSECFEFLGLPLQILKFVLIFIVILCIEIHGGTYLQVGRCSWLNLKKAFASCALFLLLCQGILLGAVCYTYITLGETDQIPFTSYGQSVCTTLDLNWDKCTCDPELISVQSNIVSQVILSILLQEV